MQKTIHASLDDLALKIADNLKSDVSAMVAYHGRRSPYVAELGTHEAILWVLKAADLRLCGLPVQKNILLHTSVDGLAGVWAEVFGYYLDVSPLQSGIGANDVALQIVSRIVAKVYSHFDNTLRVRRLWQDGYPKTMDRFPEYDYRNRRGETCTNFFVSARGSHSSRMAVNGGRRRNG